MNKAELIADVAERMSDSKMKAEEAVNAVFEAITDAMKKGDEVRLPTFGVFAVSETAERKARNPQTGEPWGPGLPFLTVALPQGRVPHGGARFLWRKRHANRLR